MCHNGSLFNENSYIGQLAMLDFFGIWNENDNSSTSYCLYDGMTAKTKILMKLTFPFCLFLWLIVFRFTVFYKSGNLQIGGKMISVTHIFTKVATVATGTVISVVLNIQNSQVSAV